MSAGFPESVDGIAFGDTMRIQFGFPAVINGRILRVEGEWGDVDNQQADLVATVDKLRLVADFRV